MTVSEFLTHTAYALFGTDDDAPTVGDEIATYWIDTLNRKKNELYNNPKILWDSTFAVTPPNEPGTVATTGTTTLTGTNTKFLDYNVGDKVTVSGETVRTIATITSDTVLTVTAAFSNTASSKTFTRTTIVDDSYTEYSLHRNFIAPANRVKITTTDSDDVYYDFVKPRENYSAIRRAYVAGVNPQILTFTSAITSTENIVGGTLYVPGYYMPEDVSAATDELPLPDPYWGVMAVAAEIAFGDITYEDKVEGLQTKANALYSQMVRNNRRNTYGYPYTLPRNVNRIRGTEVN